MTDPFLELLGRPGQRRFVAPGRVNLIGEYTDLNEGFVLPLALAKVTRVEAAFRKDRLLRLCSLQQGDPPRVVEVDLDRTRPAELSGWSRYPAAVAWALEAAGHRVGGADLLFDSDVPIGAGLSSSAALECSVALALSDLHGLGLAPMQLAQLAQRAENEFVGVPCGLMDQAASLCCRAGHALLLDTRSLEIHQVPFDLQSAGLVLLVVDTRVQHHLGESAYADRRGACEAAAAALGVKALRDVPLDQIEATLGRLDDPELRKRARHVLTEQARVLRVVHLLSAGDIPAIGPVLSEGHRSLRDDLEVSCPELDTVVEAALGAGAYGARMTGGGFGGSAIVLANAEAADGIEAAVRLAFDEAGFKAPSCFATLPSEGGHREA